MNLCFKPFVHGEKFNQPIFHRNNISGFVEPVVPGIAHWALYSTHSFKILFKEGGCGTFVPLFFNLLTSLRLDIIINFELELRHCVLTLYKLHLPLFEEMMRHAYVDPNDPTKIYLQQPTQEAQLRPRTNHSSTSDQPI